MKCSALHMVSCAILMTSLSNGQTLVVETPQVWNALADSIVSQLHMESYDRIHLVVEGENTSAAVNAFLAALDHEGKRVTLTVSDGEDVPILRISGLSRTSEGSNGGQVSCQARWELPGGDAVFLGTYAKQRPLGTGSSGASLGERLLEPLIVIAGAAIVIYLFFTVRN